MLLIQEPNVEPNQVAIGANPIRVRLYYSNDDIEVLLYNLQILGFPSATVNDLRILKKQAGPGSPVDLEVNVDAGASLSLYSFITPSVYRYGTGPFAGWYFEFEVTGFSELALIYTTGTVLPVTWLSVTGQLNKGRSVIKWSTASETNSASFSVEHSADGNRFVPLKNIPAAGNSTGIRHYEYIHTNPTQGANYYRIRQTDRDGRYSHSKIILLQYSSTAMPMVLAPNPVREQLTVWLPATTEGGSLRIFNHLGQMMQQQPKVNGTTQLQINTSRLQAGLYRLQLLQPGSMKTVPFIKQ